MAELRWIGPDDPPDKFPDPNLALRDPDGLLAVGGDLSPERLLAAYRRGIFPWFNEGQPILWWSPDPRAVLLPDAVRVSRSLRRKLKRDQFTVTVDQAFDAVIAACAESRATTGTWITPEMRQAYQSLFALGSAHSVEVWEGDSLAGGLYGVGIGCLFAGESMFSAISDASKIALLALAKRCLDLGVELIDCQLPTPHLERLGCGRMPRDAFLQRVAALRDRPVGGAWRHGPRRTSALL